MNRRLVISAIVVWIIVVGCGGGEKHSLQQNQYQVNDNQTREAVLRSMTPETWEEAIQALPEIEVENPNASPEELGNELWQKICQSKTRSDRPSDRSVIDNIYDLLIKKWFTESELLLMSEASEYVFVVTVYATVKAWSASKFVFADELPDTDDRYIQTKSDAFKHSYWSALLCLYVDSKWSENITNAHEMTPRSQEPDTSMDLHNNAVGRYVYSLHHNDGAKALKAVLLEYAYHKVTVTKDDRRIGSEYLENLNILIYLRDKDDGVVQFTDDEETEKDTSQPPDFPGDPDDNSGNGLGDGGSPPNNPLPQPDTTPPAVLTDGCVLENQGNGRFRLAVLFDDPGDNVSGFNSAYLQLQDPSYQFHGIGGRNDSNPVILEVSMTGRDTGVWKVFAWAKDNVGNDSTSLDTGLYCLTAYRLMIK